MPRYASIVSVLLISNLPPSATMQSTYLLSATHRKPTQATALADARIFIDGLGLRAQQVIYRIARLAQVMLVVAKLTAVVTCCRSACNGWICGER